MNNSKSIFLAIATILEFVVIVALLVLWQPWKTTSDKKTISVTGDGAVSATPDEFTFYPSYQSKGKTVQLSISNVSKIGNGVVAKLKELGLGSDDLTTSVTTNQDYFYGRPEGGSGTNGFIAVYSITAVARDKVAAEKILQYLATTPTLYGVSPYSAFSRAKRTELELDARGKALESAKAKADQEAKVLGFVIDEVLTVSDLNQTGGTPILKEGAVSSDRDTKTITPPVLETGTQELSFSVTVTYSFK